MTEKLYKELVDLFKKQKKTISTMESCTGGGVANAITNHPGASHVLQFSAVTYSNDFKIKMGVPKETIDDFTVYSMETARDMSRKIAEFSGADYGVGVTGQLRRVDEKNPVGDNDRVFYSIYDKAKDSYTYGSIVVDRPTRPENKELVLNAIGHDLCLLINREIFMEKMIESKMAGQRGK